MISFFIVFLDDGTYRALEVLHPHDQLSVFSFAQPMFFHFSFSRAAFEAGHTHHAFAHCASLCCFPAPSLCCAISPMWPSQPRCRVFDVANTRRHRKSGRRRNPLPELQK